jgi:hypothetical protein
MAVSKTTTTRTTRTTQKRPPRTFFSAMTLRRVFRSTISNNKSNSSTHNAYVWLLLLLLLQSSFHHAAAAAAAAGAGQPPPGTSNPPVFVAEGPVLTMTLKDTDDDVTSGTGAAAASTSSSRSTSGSDLLLELWRPQLLYSITSQRPPFPKHCPAVKSLQAAIGYRYYNTVNTANAAAGETFYNNNSNNNMFPTWVEVVTKMEVLGNNNNRRSGQQPVVQLQVQSSCHLVRRSLGLLVQVVRGSNYALVRFSSSSSLSSRDDRTKGKNAMRNMMIPAELKASYYYPKVQSSAANIASIRVTPGWQRGAGLNLQLEAVTGGAGRTKLIFQYHHAGGSSNDNDSTAGAIRRNSSSSRHRTTLAVQYQPDEHHLIRPEINLVTGQVIYQYIAKLAPNKNSGTAAAGSFTATVDPTRAIEMTWVDPGLRGSWVTDITVPLVLDGINNNHKGGVIPTTLAPRIRIRRFLQL